MDLIEILKNLVQKGLLEALISEDKIQALPQLAPESLIEDLSLMKKFDVQYNMVEKCIRNSYFRQNNEYIWKHLIEIKSNS